MKFSWVVAYNEKKVLHCKCLTSSFIIFHQNINKIKKNPPSSPSAVFLSQKEANDNINCLISHAIITLQQLMPYFNMQKPNFHRQFAALDFDYHYYYYR
jgi:hypothetical protein